MFQISAQLLLRKNSEKLRPCALVDLTNAVYQLPFIHTQASFKAVFQSPTNLTNIDTHNIFSLAPQNHPPNAP